MIYDNVYLNSFYTISGDNKFKSNLLNKCDKKLKGYYFGKDTHEEGEAYLCKEAINGLIKKGKVTPELIIGTDLQNQLFSSTEGIKNNKIPFLGVFSACAGFIESMIIASSFIHGKIYKNVGIVASSSNLSSEKQFRYPIEYGAIRKPTQTFTLTGATSSIISNKKSDVKIESSTIGQIVDVGFKDVNNMGGVMASAAAQTIYDHLTYMKRKSNYYDLIVTGDLGIYGVEILKKYMLKKYKIKLDNLVDAGSMLLDVEKNKFPAGGSGPACIGLYLFNKVLKEKKYKHILLVGTGALFSKSTTNLKKSLSSVAHAVSLEVK